MWQLNHLTKQGTTAQQAVLDSLILRSPVLAALHALRNIVASQKSVCDKFGVDFFPPKDCEKIGIAIETIGKMPINGMRIDPENGTCGWYIWCGEELSEDPEFYKPLHVSHINKYLPEIEKYLALPSGYKFLVAGDYEDVWQDPLLNSM